MPVTISGSTGITNVDGSASVPAEKGSTSSTAGVFFPAANTVAISTSSTEALRVDSSQNVGIGTASPGYRLDVNSGSNFIAGRFTSTSTATIIPFVDSTTTGIGPYVGSTGDALTFGRAGVSEYMRIDSSGNVGIGTASPQALIDAYSTGNTTLRLSGSSGGGGDVSQIDFFRIGSNVEASVKAVRDGSNTSGALTFYTASSGTNTERARIDSSGNLLVGTTSNNGRLCVVGNSTTALFVQSSGNTNATYPTIMRNSDSVNLFFVRSDGYVAMPAVYSTWTSGSAANLGIDSSGGLYRSVSSLKYKRDVQNATHGLAEVMQLRPVTYKGKSENDSDTVFGGLIAEEVHAVGLTEFVQYADDGSPDALAYGNMVSLLVKAIQELKAEIDTLKGAK
jgi:hypothetical protein